MKMRKISKSKAVNYTDTMWEWMAWVSLGLYGSESLQKIGERRLLCGNM